MILHRNTTKSCGRSSHSVSVRVGGIASRLRLGAVGNFVARVAIAFAGNDVNTVRSNALLQFFHFEQNRLFHLFSPPARGSLLVFTSVLPNPRHLTVTSLAGGLISHLVPDGSSVHVSLLSSTAHSRHSHVRQRTRRRRLSDYLMSRWTPHRRCLRSQDCSCC